MAQIAVNHQGDRLAIGDSDGKIHLFQLLVADDKRSLQLQRQYLLDAHPSRVTTLQFSPDGQWLASSGRDNLIQVWRMTNAILSQTLSGHATPIQAIVFSADNQYLASSSTDIVKLWQVGALLPQQDVKESDRGLCDTH